jgi:DNA polymerase IV (DinB-like DNA polymerase)
VFLHLDMDYFYAQIEERRRPMSRGKIIAVCMFSGRTKDSGVISTVNYAGREVGIYSGMPIALAKKRAPPADTIFVPADREHYSEVSMQIDEIVRDSCEKVVQASIDEWNCEDANAEEKAPGLKRAILDGLGLTCSIGVAPSLLGAKMAASKSKPNGLLVLDSESERKLIDGSDVRKVPGIGSKTAEALAAAGIRRVSDLRGADPLMLVESFGRKSGGWLHKLGMGEYATELGPEKEQEEVSRIGTLREKSRDVGTLIVKSDALEKEAREWLMHMKKSFRTISVIFVTEDMKIHTKSMSFRNPMPWNADIADEKKQLIEEFLKENDLMVRRIGIRFGNFMDLGGQTTLF